MGLLNRAKNLYRDAGLGAVLKQVLTVLRIYENHHYYIFVTEMKPLDDESKHLPKIDVSNITHKTVTSQKQLDELIADGFTFEGQDLDYIKYALGKGAIGEYLFVGKELASSGWEATTKKAKEAFDKKPYKVDFTNNEVCFGGNWTKAEYRGRGLSTYLSIKRLQYHIARGIIRTRSIVEVNNVASLRQREKVGWEPAPYAKAHFLRIMGIGFWKETPINRIDDST